MNAGDMDRRITFQERSGSQDSDTGAYTYSWANLASNPTVWAKVIEETRPERVEDGIAMADGPVVIFIRYRSDITSDMRIIYGSRTLRITGRPAEINRDHWLKITAADFVTAGDEP